MKKHAILALGSALLVAACGGRVSEGFDDASESSTVPASNADSGDAAKTVINMTIDAEEGADPSSSCVPGSQPGCTVYYSDGSVTYGYIVCQENRRWGACMPFDKEDAEAPSALGTPGNTESVSTAPVSVKDVLEEITDDCPAGQKTCHDCRALDIEYPVTLPWGENYSLAGTDDGFGFMFLQNDGGEMNPAVLRTFGYAGTPVIQSIELPTSNWQASAFSSSSGFVVITMEHSENPGTLLKLDRHGNVVNQRTMRLVSGAEGQNGSDLLIDASVNASSTEFVNNIQLIDADGNPTKSIHVSTVAYNEDGKIVSYPYINSPSMVEDTVGVPNGIAYFDGVLKGSIRSRFDIAKIDGSGTVSAAIDETSSLNASWSIGNAYFLWSTRAGEGEYIDRIRKDGTVAARFELEERPSLVVKRPSGFATLVRENLSLYRYTWSGKLLSANMLIPGMARDGSEIALAASGNSNFVVAVSNKAQHATNLYFVVCE